MPTAPTYPNADPQLVEQLLADIGKLAVADLRQGPKDRRAYMSARAFLRKMGVLDRVEQQIEQEHHMAQAKQKLPRFRVSFNTHQYSDHSDTARPATRIVRASDADAAMAALKQIGKVGKRYIGMVHMAEEVSNGKQ